MKTSKYYVMYRVSPNKLGFATSETDKWHFYCILNNFNEVKELVEKEESLQFRVIKGVELEFEEEVQEIITKTRVVKSRKLKNV